MISHYVVRLACLCLASFFLVNLTAGLAAGFASRAAVRIAELMRPRSAARFLFVLRALPFALGAAAVLGLCVPSYLWLEPHAASERIGLACLILALAGAVSWAGSLVRVTLALAASVRCSRAWQQTGRESFLPGELSKAIVIEKDAPFLVLAGVFRPRLVVSQAVLRSLSGEQLALALRHEKAHRVSRDNLKRLFLLLAPPPIPFLRAFSPLERHWARFSEWAADDDAVRGDAHCALALAAALLRLARMGAAPRLTLLNTALLAAANDLSARVDRLLTVQPLRTEPRARKRSAAVGVGLGIVACLPVLLMWPAALSSVHRLLELFLR
jgi:Zn-dependent protease with chaperone function